MLTIISCILSCVILKKKPSERYLLASDKVNIGVINMLIAMIVEIEMIIVKREVSISEFEEFETSAL